mgnify:CR=1 FL=1
MISRIQTVLPSTQKFIAVIVMLLLAGATAGCDALFPVHNYEASYAMEGYTLGSLRTAMEERFTQVEAEEPTDVSDSEIAIQVDEHRQAMCQITEGEQGETLLTLRMLMWEEGHELTEAGGLELFEAKVIQPLKADADSAE